MDVEAIPEGLRGSRCDFWSRLARLFAAITAAALVMTMISCARLGPTEQRGAEEPREDTSQGEDMKQWNSPPPQSIDATKIYVATFRTQRGDIKVQLFAAQAPKTVNNFVFLAQEGFYDNTTFHRVLPGFMAQGGDPSGTGRGGPGYRFEDEFDPNLRFDEGGYLAMANAGPNTNGSQFFLTFVATPHLNGRHTIFGKVVEGMEVLLSLKPRDPSQNPDFVGDRLITVAIEEVSASLLPTATSMP